MNWHFIFFLLDIIGWISIALFFSFAFATRPYKFNLNILNKVNTVIFALFIALFAGLFSVFTQGLPDMGFSMNSFVYAFFASFGFIIYQRIKIKKVYPVKISKRYKKSAYV